MGFTEQKVEKKMNKGSFLDEWMKNCIGKNISLSGKEVGHSFRK